MVQAGQIYFPNEVRKDMAEVRHPDTPGTWALNAYEHMRWRIPMCWLKPLNFGSEAGRTWWS